MSDKHILHCSADRDEQQQQKTTRKTSKEEENNRLRQQYPLFEIPTSFYKVVHVTKYISIDEMHLMINHVEECTQFTIDTESERSNGQLALIQVQAIPPRIPLLVILIELAHLPPNNSHVYAKIKKLFELIFRFGNKLYLWGDMSKELDPSKGYRLFNWPILASIVDIQPRFSSWYEWALTQCESCRPKHRLNGLNDINVTTQNYSSLMCACHEQSPYGPQEKWPP